MARNGILLLYNSRIAVDLTENLVADPVKMRASKSAAPQSQFAYVFAFAEAGVLDVTLAYTKDASKFRIQEDMDYNLGTWIQRFNWLVTPSRESQGPAYVKEARKMKEKRDVGDTTMPTNLAGFNNHPVYALERHLKKGKEILAVGATSIGLFKQEPIYKRVDVKIMKSREQWIKAGMQVKDDVEPAVYVKVWFSFLMLVIVEGKYHQEEKGD
jgi:xeroderma pigmentosum group C-complementing protein